MAKNAAPPKSAAGVSAPIGPLSLRHYLGPTSTPLNHGMLSVEIVMPCCRIRSQNYDNSKNVHLFISAAAVNIIIISLST